MRKLHPGGTNGADELCRREDQLFPLYGCVCVCEREQRDRETERQRDRETERQRDRETEGARREKRFACVFECVCMRCVNETGFFFSSSRTLPMPEPRSTKASRAFIFTAACRNVSRTDWAGNSP
jgi:hypothetical protein